MMFKKYLLLFCLCFGLTPAGLAQMQRERVQTNQIAQETFWAPNLIGMGTVEQLAKGNLNVTIMHNFGIATERPLQTFFGLDSGPNVRLGLDYGLTPHWSVGVGRSTFEKVVDFRTKLRLLSQTINGATPFSLSLKVDIGLTTLENNRPVEDDLSYLVSVPIARKFGEKLSLQISPMFARFNAVNQAFSEQEELFGIGTGGEFRISRRYALMAEYYFTTGERNPGTSNAFSVGLNIETGGHVFQLYLASSNLHLEQYIMAGNRDNFFVGDFRFGFNVNRLFFLGSN